MHQCRVIFCSHSPLFGSPGRGRQNYFTAVIWDCLVRLVLCIWEQLSNSGFFPDASFPPPAVSERKTRPWVFQIQGDQGKRGQDLDLFTLARFSHILELLCLRCSPQTSCISIPCTVVRQTLRPHPRPTKSETLETGHPTLVSPFFPGHPNSG